MDEKKEAVEELIVKFLANHRHGVFVDDFMRWWLELGRTWHTEDDITILMDNLVNQGLVRKRLTDENKVHYQLVTRYKDENA
jgi:hypothetical protein